MNYYIPQSLAMFQVLNNHLWLVATILDSTDIHTTYRNVFISLYFTTCQIFMEYLYSSTNDTAQTHNTVPHSWRFHLK